MGTPGQRVLVVEDDAHIRALLNEALGDEGYEVRVAANGRVALELVADWTPHLIVLDLMMPEIDGWRFRARQLADPDLSDVPVLVMSAAHGRTLRDDELGDVTFVQKPFELDALIERIGEMLEPSAPGGGGFEGPTLEGCTPDSQMEPPLAAGPIYALAIRLASATVRHP